MARFDALARVAGPLTALSAGDTITLPEGTSAVASTLVSASGGVTIPADPY